MTTLETAVSVPQVPLRAATCAASFVGRNEVFWRLLTRGAVLLMFTLGIYRFWLTTDVRRYLWSSTQLADDNFEYTGTARELLLGFLIAIALLVPLYVTFFLLGLALGEIWSLLGLIMLTFLGQYAVYRARRYRLTRTIYRGVRFHQSGSAWRYSASAVFWWTLAALTLGLAYPLAQSRLEHFKMRNTFFGNLPGRFEGSAWQLLMRGLLLWAVAVVPVAIGTAASIMAVDWTAFTSAASSVDAASRVEASGLAGGVVVAALTGAWLLLSIAILYPIFQAIVLRWWISGLRFGDIAVESKLRAGQVYAVYARFVAYAAAFTAVAGCLLGIAAFALAGLTARLDPMSGEILSTVLGVAAYVAIALGYSTIYQATVKLGLWRCVVESSDISNPQLLEQVSAAGEPSSPVGEGLADALNVGGL
jgi:uncharacterized membrane protein YjgN (DUF898 family)